MPCMMAWLTQPRDLEQVIIIFMMPLNALSSIKGKRGQPARFARFYNENPFANSFNNNKLRLGCSSPAIKMILVGVTKMWAESYATSSQNHIHSLPGYAEGMSNMLD